jgi:hypothetical protein
LRQAPPLTLFLIQRPDENSKWHAFPSVKTKLRDAVLAVLRIAAAPFSELRREANEAMAAATELERLVAATGSEADLIRDHRRLTGSHHFSRFPIQIAIGNLSPPPR